MKTKEKYSVPEIEVIELNLEGVVAYSISEDPYDGPAYSKRKGLWEEEK